MSEPGVCNNYRILGETAMDTFRFPQLEIHEAEINGYHLLIGPCAGAYISTDDFSAKLVRYCPHNMIENRKRTYRFRQHRLSPSSRPHHRFHYSLKYSVYYLSRVTAPVQECGDSSAARHPVLPNSDCHPACPERSRRERSRSIVKDLAALFRSHSYSNVPQERRDPSRCSRMTVTLGKESSPSLRLCCSRNA
jgi:hypothetical protein